MPDRKIKKSKTNDTKNKSHPINDGNDILHVRRSMGYYSKFLESQLNLLKEEIDGKKLGLTNNEEDNIIINRVSQLNTKTIISVYPKRTQTELLSQLSWFIAPKPQPASDGWINKFQDENIDITLDIVEDKKFLSHFPEHWHTKAYGKADHQQIQKYQKSLDSLKDSQLKLEELKAKHAKLESLLSSLTWLEQQNPASLNILVKKGSNPTLVTSDPKLTKELEHTKILINKINKKLGIAPGQSFQGTTIPFKPNYSFVKSQETEDKPSLESILGNLISK